MAWGVPIAACATPISAPAFASLAERCAPAVPAKTLEAVARTESGLDPWALHDNTTGVSEIPASQDQAQADAAAWISRGDSVDVGLMQINSANFGALGLTASAALDPCASLARGAAVLQAAYGGGTTTAEQQVALLMALSRYNTGSPLKGIMNGYAHTVMVNAGSDPVPTPATGSSQTTPVLTDPSAPPAWNIAATGTYAQTHGAPWIVSLATPSGEAKQPAGQPVPAAANSAVAVNIVAASSTQARTRSP
jgi:type IV secretion system protein VirB1